jgi:hypothetical protein
LHVGDSGALPERAGDGPEDERRDDPAVPDRIAVDREREVDPDHDRPHRAEADRDIADLDDRLHAKRLLGRIHPAHGDDENPEKHESSHVGERAQNMDRQRPVDEAHAAIIPGRSAGDKFRARTS